MKQLILFSIISLVLLQVVTAPPPQTGSIWTTNGDCGGEQQDVNHYAIGDTIYINGANFEEEDYSWEITGQPGGASCDPNTVVVFDIQTVNNNGAFCFAAYTVQADDCGEYQVTFGKKHDNYRVDDDSQDEVPEFGVIAGIAALAGAGLIIYKRRK